MKTLNSILRNLNQRANPVQVWLDTHRSGLLRVLNVGLVLLALMAAGSLLGELGFYLSPEEASIARAMSSVVLYGFVVQGLLRVLLSRQRLAYITVRWFESILLALIIFVLLAPDQLERLLLSVNPLLSPDAITRIYVLVMQTIALVAFIPAGFRYSNRIMRANVQPSTLILVSFLVLIMVGTLLLLLPRATVTNDMPLIDAVFTATSAACVTGLTVVDTKTFFSPFGHTILLVLFQVGGLGIMTLTTFFAFVMGGSSSLKEYASLRSMLGEENIGRIRRTVVRIALMTFVIELIGTIALYALTGTGLHANDGERLFFSMFHAVSAFCNAGFTIAAENIATQGIQSNFPFLGAVMALVVLGGLGFPVLSNIWAVLLRRPAGTGMRRLTVHSKLVLITSAVLLLIGAAGIAILEQDRSMEHFKTVELLFHSLFQSVCARTAGFNTVGVAALSAPTGMLLMLLMWIGASPGSTGGGIKTTSIALAVLNIRSLASGRTKVEVFKKRVSDLAIVRAFSTIILSVLFAATMFFLLVLIEDTPFRDLAFETVSALGTVGLSAGVTPELSPVGKGLLIVTMLAGRVGLFAFVLALTRRKSEGVYEYTEENVLVT